jgi:multicomponent Na+:H+ antiporter subunit D
LLAGLFLVSALSLAGIPPFSGFFAKLGLVQAGIANSQYAVTGVALAVGLLTLYSMTKIWNEAFWKAAPAPPGESAPVETAYRLPARTMLAASFAFAVLAVGLGIAAGPAMEVTLLAAENLLAPDAYIEAVLGGELLVKGGSQ